MGWRSELREQIQQGFPAPRRREPGGLRRDIEDELADHLACAVQRELVTTDDEAKARRAALERFGDPKKLARKLWFDAMKEQIMKDRVMMVSLAVLALAAVAATVFVWKSMEQNRLTNQAMIAALEKLANTSKPAQAASDLATLKVRVVKNSANGQPMADVRLSLLGAPFEGSKAEDLSATTSRDGSASFGPVRPGKYGLTTILPAGLKNSREAIMYGGAERELAIIAPDTTSGTLTFAPQIPDSLKNSRPWTAVRFFGNIKTVDHESWEFEDSVAINPAGQMSQCQTSDRDETSDLLRLFDPLASPLKLPSIAFKLLSLSFAHGMAPERGQGYYRIIDAHHYTYDQAPTFQVKPGIQNTWTLPFPEGAKSKLEWAELLARTKLEAGVVDEGLALVVQGSIQKIFPVEKDTMILKYIPDWNRGDVDNIAIANNDGGVRTLIGWDKVFSGEDKHPEFRFMLALYSRKTDDRFSSNTLARKGAICASAITARWDERDSWKNQPPIEAEPTACFDFVPGVGWKLFDVTPIVRKQIEAGKPYYGVMLHFNKEDYSGNKQDWSGYQFVSREGIDNKTGDPAAGPWANKHPVLLIVKPRP